jgi:hypothetical protein
MGPLLIAGLKAAPALIEGGIGLYQNITNARQAKQRQESAREAFDASRQAYFEQDVSNPYMNMENTYEDLTVNQQQAQFQAQQQQQGLADVMGGMRQSAGASGIAAFAQSLANQQASNMQQASTSIGMQESANQRLQAGEAARLQQVERGGDVYSRQLKADLMGTRLGMDMADLQAQTEALQGFRSNIAGGVGQIAGGVLSGYDAFKSADGAGEAMANLTKGITGPLTKEYDPNEEDVMIKSGGYTPSYQIGG